MTIEHGLPEPTLAVSPSPRYTIGIMGGSQKKRSPRASVEEAMMFSISHESTAQVGYGTFPPTLKCCKFWRE
jgi:hypothetical protein